MVKTKRIISFIVAIIAATGVCFLTACSEEKGADNAHGSTSYSFAISKTDVMLEEGESEKLECTYGDKNIVFSSSDENVATVSQDGTINAKSVGVAYITAKADGVDGAEKMCKVTVVKYEYSVKIDREENITAVINDKSVTLDFVAAVYKNGAKTDISVKFTVSPSGADVVTDGNTLKVTFSSVGVYTIKAEYADAFAIVTVNAVNDIA